MSFRIALFGAAGQLGVELGRELGARGYSLIGCTHAELDISDGVRVDDFLSAARPAMVINAAAYNQVDAAEGDPRAAWDANALAVLHMARACRRLGARLVHYSTDYVFDGAKGAPYVESDPVHPLGAYAVSKLGGELYARAYLDEPLVIRTSGVFGPAGRHTARGNFPELMLRLAGEGKPIRVVDDHVASPTYAPALAARSLDLIERGCRGVFHIGGGRPVSWYDFARLIFHAAGIAADLRATNRHEYPTSARRPLYSALSNAKMESLGVAPMPALEDALEAYMRKRAV
jgi:dTDP-4-dehydrorhamnose reductase